MPRPSMQEQRSAEIVDAFAECVAEVGVEASTLQLVADRAGVHKSIIRHYVGSRSDLVVALVDRALARYDAISEHALASAGDDPRDRLDAYVDSLFVAEEPYEGALFTSLMLAGSPYPEAGASVQRQLDRAGSTLLTPLADAYPQASADSLAVIAVGIGAMSLSASESMGATRADVEQLRLAAHRLAATAATTCSETDGTPD